MFLKMYIQYTCAYQMEPESRCYYRALDVNEQLIAANPPNWGYAVTEDTKGPADNDPSVSDDS